jgi:hypothetical protein
MYENHIQFLLSLGHTNCDFNVLHFTIFMYF